MERLFVCVPFADHLACSEGGGQSTVLTNLRDNDPRQVLFRNSNADAEKQYVYRCAITVRVAVGAHPHLQTMAGIQARV